MFMCITYTYLNYGSNDTGSNDLRSRTDSKCYGGKKFNLSKRYLFDDEFWRKKLKHFNR